MTNIDDPKYALQTQLEAGRARRRPPKAAVAWTVGILAAVGIIIGVMVNVGTDIEEPEALGWDVSTTEGEVDGVKSISVNLFGSFTGEDALRVASGELGVEDSAIGDLPIVTVTETEDEFLYRITFGPTVTNSADVEPVEGDSFGDTGGFDLSGLEDFVAASLSELLDFTWTVRFPGELVESNATSTSGNRATWELNFTEVASEDELYIVSRVSKNQGGGSCSAPAQAYERG